MTDIERQLALSLFAEGFKAAAATARVRKGAPPIDEHVYFIAGFRAGRHALDAAIDAYQAFLKET